MTTTRTTPTTGRPRARRGDELPRLILPLLREADPSPPQGPARDALADAAADRVERAEHVMVAAAEQYAARVRGVVLARLQGPKARKHTRHWATSTDLTAVAGKADHPSGYETKQIDPDYVVPDSLIGESVEALREAAASIAGESAQTAVGRVGGGSGDGGMFEVDHALLADLIDEALEDMLAGAERYADRVRDAVAEGEADGLSLDDLADAVDEAAGKGGAALAREARTAATALAGRAVLDQARALGVTHVQWISRRDERVRHAHREADGQVRALGDMFDVGGFLLEYPGDPSGLPATASQVLNCRCGLLLADVDDAFHSALAEISAAAMSPDEPPGVGELFEAARASRIYRPSPELADVTGAPDGVNLTPAPMAVTGWRVLDVTADAVPGQVVDLPAGTVLALAPPERIGPETLAVRVPAGTLVGVADGVMTLPDGAHVTVLADGQAGTQLALF